MCVYYRSNCFPEARIDPGFSTDDLGEDTEGNVKGLTFGRGKKFKEEGIRNSKRYTDRKYVEWKK
jgi:hypothetical protein